MSAAAQARGTSKGGKKGWQKRRGGVKKSLVFSPEGAYALEQEREGIVGKNSSIRQHKGNARRRRSKVEPGVTAIVRSGGS